MHINKLDLLSKGWNVSEIEQASQIIAHAEESKHSKSSLMDKLLIALMVVLMVVNGFVCSALITALIFTIPGVFMLVLAALVGLIFGVVFSITINDIERLHAKQEANMLVVLLINGLIGFYFIVTFGSNFETRTGLAMLSNVYVVASLYLVAFIMPHIIYEARKING